MKGRKIPAEGSLYYQGYNVYDIVNGLNGRKFGFEETAFLLLFGRMPNQEELDKFVNLLFEFQGLGARFERDVVMKA